VLQSSADKEDGTIGHRSRIGAAALYGAALIVAALLALLVLASLRSTCAGDGGKTSAAGKSVGKTKKPTAAATASASPTSSPTVAATGGPKNEPRVYLLGGSSARECITGNASWAAQVKKLGGPQVRACDLGASNEGFDQDMVLVRAMPKGPTLVLIGVSVGRYTGEPGEDVNPADPGLTVDSIAEVKHKYHVGKIIPEEGKQNLVDKWVTTRYPVFQANYEYNAGQLEQLVKLCRQRHFRPVLLELPLNFDIVGARFDAPRARYRKGVRALAKRYDIPYLDFGADLGLVNGDFYDLMHLVEPGRGKWQKRLSEEVVKLLKEYGMGGR